MEPRKTQPGAIPGGSNLYPSRRKAGLGRAPRLRGRYAASFDAAENRRPPGHNSCKGPDEGDDLGYHDAQHHDARIGDDVDECLFHAGLSFGGLRGFHLWVGPQVKTPPEGEAFEDGQANTLAIAMTWDTTTISTISFRLVTTFNRDSFMTFSSKSQGETSPRGRDVSPGGGSTANRRERSGRGAFGLIRPI